MKRITWICAQTIAMMFLIFQFLIISENASAAGNYTTVNLPNGVSIQLPNNWIIFSNNKRITQDSAVDAIFELSELEIVASELLFAANLYDDNSKTIGITNIRYYPDLFYDILQADVREWTDTDVRELDSEIRGGLLQASQSVGFEVTAWKGTKKKEINGVTALVTEYQRTSMFGPGYFRVRLVRVLAGDRSFTLTVSYKESLSFLLRPITDYIIYSVKVDGLEGTSIETAAATYKPTESTITSYSYEYQWWEGGIILLLIVCGIGLLPPLLTRFIIFKRPLGKGWAVSLVVLLWMVNLILFMAIGVESPGAPALFALVSYKIMTKGKKKITASVP